MSREVLPPPTPAPRGGGLRLPALRLRHKLGVSLVITALLPLLVASWVAVSVVLRSLNQGLHEQTERQLDVGLNLLLRNVKDIGDEAVRLSGDAELGRAVTGSQQELDEALSRLSRHLPSALVQVADATGALRGERVAGDSVERFKGLGVESSSAAIQAGMKYERRFTIVPIRDRLVVRAAAPLVDDSLQLRGVVVLSMPLDADVAEQVKAALRADVLIFAGSAAGTPGTSTFADPIGQALGGLTISEDVSREIQPGRSVFRTATILDQEYALGYTPIINLAGEIVGVFGVAVDRAPLGAARAMATRSLALGAAGAFVFALGLAGLLSRRMTRPIAHLHQGALAVARGDLDHQIDVTVRDEIGDLAAAFSHMTSALKDNQRRLAARMREIVALHDAGRAVSSVLELEQVLRKIVDSVARVLHVRVCALWLAEASGQGGLQLRLGAARAKRGDGRIISRGEDVSDMLHPLAAIARAAGETRAPLRIHRVVDDDQWHEAAVAAGVTGSLVATPLERKGSVLGVIIIGRARDARSFSEADANLLATFADQAATAIENASLYSQVRSWSEELEQKVDLRTAELTHMNKELGRTIQELRDTQAQLLLSERLAGLGHLVAAVAHEINSPSAAIRGTVDALADQVRRLTQLAHELPAIGLSVSERGELLRLAGQIGAESAVRRLPPPSAVRRAARELRAALEADHLPADDAAESARQIAELDLSGEEMTRLRRLLGGPSQPASPAQAPAPGAAPAQRARILVGYVAEYAHLQRSLFAIEHAIRRIQRIVGGLKSYSHLDQDASAQQADLHEGIEETLELLDHLLARGIRIHRRYGAIPRVPVFVDELNQVWTNLIHNAVQALDGQGEIAIETQTSDGGVAVRVIDNGPGIPDEVMPRMFDPLYTTKPRGEGSGLGLSIVRRILERHGGNIRVESRPGRTSFEVWLPLGPGGARDSGAHGPEA
ncbi:MAG TPA: ATP-binding protein [Kofleriaceae bacterium]|nr:ATP-binding protein [Kofleriaceae bacterium]